MSALSKGVKAFTDAFDDLKKLAEQEEEVEENIAHLNKVKRENIFMELRRALSKLQLFKEDREAIKTIIDKVEAGEDPTPPPPAMGETEALARGTLEKFYHATSGRTYEIVILGEIPRE